MKRYMVAILAGMLLLGFAASAMAEVAINGSFRVRLWYAGNYDLNEDLDVDDPGTFVDTRLRLLLDAKVAENVQVFGNFDINEKRFGGTSDEVNYYAFQVNEAFLKFLVPSTPIWLQVGRQDVSWYFGVLGALTDYRDRLKVNVPLKDLGITIGCAMDTNYESVNTGQTNVIDDDDSTGYSAWFRYAIAGWDLGLLGVYAVDGSSSTATKTTYTTVEVGHEKITSDPVTTTIVTDNDNETFVVGLGATGAAGPVKIGFEGAFKTGTTKVTTFDTAKSMDTVTEKDVQGFGALVTASIPAGPVGLSVALAYASGDDPSTADKNESFAFDADGPVNGVILWANNWAPEIVPQAGNYAKDTGFSNALGAKLALSFSPVKPLVLGAAVLAAQTVEDDKLGNGGLYGTEIDVTASYEIATNVSLSIGAGYLIPGAYLKDYVKLNEKTVDDKTDTIGAGWEDAALGGVIKFEVKF